MNLAGNRVLFLVPEDHYFVSHRLNFAKRLMEQGAEVHLLTKMSRFGDELSNAGVHYREWGYARAAIGISAQMHAVRRLKSCLKEVRPDVIHAVALKPILYCGAVKFWTRDFVPTINAIAGLGSAFLRRPGRRSRFVRMGLLPALSVALNERNCLVAAQNDGDVLALKKLGVAEERINLIGGVGVDLKRFKFSEERDSAAPIVMFASRLLKDKGLIEFVEAARLLKANGATARFVLVGAPDPDNPSSVTQQQVDQWTNEKMVEHWGPQRDMAEILPQAAIVCLPSYSEGTPKVLLESAACGRPIVSTDIPGCRFVVDGGITGILVPPREVPPLAHAIQELLSEPARRKNMGAAARKKAERSFSVEQANARMMALYEKLLTPRSEFAVSEVAG